MGLLVTVGTLAAIYFFLLRPVLDTTTDAIDSISGPIERAQEQVDEALLQSKNAGNTGRTNQLQRCVKRAGQNPQRLQRCVSRFGP